MRRPRITGDTRLQGIACALGELAETHAQPDLAKKVLQTLGLTTADLRAAGADPHDITLLSAQAHEPRR